MFSIEDADEIIEEFRVHILCGQYRHDLKNGWDVEIYLCPSCYTPLSLEDIQHLDYYQCECGNHINSELVKRFSVLSTILGRLGIQYREMSEPILDQGHLLENEYPNVYVPVGQTEDDDYLLPPTPPELAWIAGAIAGGILGNAAYDLIKRGYRDAADRIEQRETKLSPTVVHEKLLKLSDIEQRKLVNRVFMTLNILYSNNLIDRMRDKFGSIFVKAKMKEKQYDTDKEFGDIFGSRDSKDLPDGVRKTGSYYHGEDIFPEEEVFGTTDLDSQQIKQFLTDKPSDREKEYISYITPLSLEKMEGLERGEISQKLYEDFTDSMMSIPHYYSENNDPTEVLESMSSVEGLNLKAKKNKGKAESSDETLGKDDYNLDDLESWYRDALVHIINDEVKQGVLKLQDTSYELHNTTKGSEAYRISLSSLIIYTAISNRKESVPSPYTDLKTKEILKNSVLSSGIIHLYECILHENNGCMDMKESSGVVGNSSLDELEEQVAFRIINENFED